MRTSHARSLTISILLVSLLSACASTKDLPPSKHIAQSGPLKVHPGLLGLPVPPELAPPVYASQKAEDSDPVQDEASLWAQRSIYFDVNQADVKSAFDPVLAAHARYLARNPAARVRIEGHADERGSPQYNRTLGLKRAQSVRAMLLGQGADAQQLSVKSWGKSKPKVVGRDESAWAENRRADIVYEREQ